MVSAEQKEYAEVFNDSKTTEKSVVITDYWIRFCEKISLTMPISKSRKTNEECERKY